MRTGAGLALLTAPKESQSVKLTPSNPRTNSMTYYRQRNEELSIGVSLRIRYLNVAFRLYNPALSEAVIMIFAGVIES